MILLLDTTTPECHLTLIEGDIKYETMWHADRELAKSLLEYIVTQLSAHNKTIQDLTGLGVLRGPGSFTGLRIGITTLNTIADAQLVPIVGEIGSKWQESAIKRLLAGDNDQIVLPEYGRDARITKPRK